MPGFDKTARTRSSANFSVRYVLSGSDAVLRRRSGATDGLEIPGLRRSRGGTPDYVLRVLYWAERALRTYTGAPFHLRNPAETEKIRIHIARLHEPGRAGRKRIIVLNRNLSPDVLAMTVAHELFHVIQYAYPRNGGRWRASVIEGGAVYAEQFVTGEFYDTAVPAPGKLRSYHRIVQEPARPLTVAAYDCGLFWGYVGDQADAARRTTAGRPFGPRLYKSVIERCTAHGYGTADIRRAIGGKVPGTDLCRFRYDGAGPNRNLLNAETLIGNFAMAGCLQDNGLVPCDYRFALMAESTGAEGKSVMPADVAAFAGSCRDPRATEYRMLKTDKAVVLHGTVGDFGSRFHGLDIHPSLDTLRLKLATSAPDRGLILQIGLVDRQGTMVDIIRTDRRQFERTIGLFRNPDRIERLVLVATGIVNSAEYEITVAPAPPRPDVMLTRWNAPPGRELERPPLKGARMWQSPDVSAKAPGMQDGLPTPRTPGRIETVLRNRGVADATQGELRLFYQWADKLPHASRWRPLCGTNDTPARARIARVPAGDAHRIALKVLWPDRGGGVNLFILASAFCGNDDNAGNKAAVTRWCGPARSD